MPGILLETDLSEHYNCVKCGQCCHSFEMIVNSRTLKIDGSLVKEAFKKDLRVDFEDVEQCSVKVNVICEHFDKTKGLCKIYDRRPKICRYHFCQRYPKIDEEK